MACNVNGIIALDCMDALGGVKSAWVLGGTSGAIASYSINGTDQITGITGAGSFYLYDLPKDTASYTETITPAPTNGTVFYQGALVMNFQKLDTTKRNQIKLLAKNRNLKVVILDNNGKYWALGFDRGMQMSTGTAATGVAPGDASQFSITLQSMEPNPAYEITPSLSAVLSGITIVAT